MELARIVFFADSCSWRISTFPGITLFRVRNTSVQYSGVASGLSKANGWLLSEWRPLSENLTKPSRVLASRTVQFRSGP